MKANVHKDNRYVMFCDTKLPYSRDCMVTVYKREIVIIIDKKKYYFVFDSIGEAQKMKKKFNNDYLKVSSGN